MACLVPNIHHHHHQAAVVSRGWAKASACRLQMTLSCAVLCHIVSLQYSSRSSFHRLAGLFCRLFLSYGLQVVTRDVHRSSLRRLICPAQDHFIFLTNITISKLQHKPKVPIAKSLQQAYRYGIIGTSRT